jgi:adenosylcobinamide kinase/adenosylcobinamide-phosphate guanylyltransferase
VAHAAHINDVAPALRVSYVATYQAANDPEMLQRIEHHRANRPASWRTIEEPLALARAVETAAHDSDAILVDCLTIWLSNLFWEHRDNPTHHVEEAAHAELKRIAVAAMQCHVILVSNEVGSGTVPTEHAVTRAFRDVQGLLNQWAAEAADEVILAVAGLPLYLKTAPQHEGAPGEAEEK